MGICFHLYPEEKSVGGETSLKNCHKDVFQPPKSLCLWLEVRLKLGVMGNYATSEVLPKI